MYILSEEGVGSCFVDGHS